MNFETALEIGLIRNIPVNKARSISLKKQVKQTIQVLLTIPLNEQTSIVLFRECYECLRQYYEAEAYIKGYAFDNHEAIQYFIHHILANPKAAKTFDTYRRIRNGINYYGNSLDITITQQILLDVKHIIQKIDTE